MGGGGGGRLPVGAKSCPLSFGGKRLKYHRFHFDTLPRVGG